MLYFTLADQPSSVYKTQAVDVVKYLNSELGVKIRLVALVSFRGYFKARKKIKGWDDTAIVLPMVPMLKHWKKNTFILKLIIKRLKPKAIIGRGIFGTGLALLAKTDAIKVCFDGRGAIHAEALEYNVYEEPIKSRTHDIEKQCVHNADYRIAVSNKLVAHWTEKYNYKDKEHIVIPCTFNPLYTERLKSRKEILDELNWNQEDKILVFSGSISAWQSFETLKKLIKDLILHDTHLRVLFLSPEHSEISSLETLYPEQVKRRWLKQEHVSSYLEIADYGILFREPSTTSAVASPVKFAEYLNAGLKVLISENIGDYSELVITEELGNVILNSSDKITLDKVSPSEKERMKKLGYSKFSKASEPIKSLYLQLLKELS